MLKRLRFSLVLFLCASIGIGPLLTMISARTTTPATKSAASSADEHTTNKSAKLVSRSTALHTTSNIRRRPSLRLPQRLASTLLPGQTGTQLIDGRWVLIGGEGQDGQLATITVWNPKTNEKIAVPTQLHHARAWHTATMLPDGTILVFGGLGITGQVLASAEIFNPETGSTELLSPTGLTPRTYQTATLLTDGRVLITGGMSDSAQTLASADIFEPFARVANSLPKGLAIPRQGQIATLLANGNVLLSGGMGKDNQELNDGEVFDPQSQQFTPADGPTLQIGTTETASAPRLEASLPSDGATDVAETTRITLRFSKSLNVQSVNNGALQLSGPSGTVDTKLVAAENGMLVFIAPKSMLEENTSYNLSINGLSDNEARTALQSQISFTTKSANNHSDTKPKAPVAPPDSVWQPNTQGVNSWRTKAERSPFQSLPPLQAPPGVTALAGQALKLNGQPLVNIAVSLDDQVAMTDETGRYLLSPVDPGHHVIIVNDHHHSAIAQDYGMFDISVDVKAGRTNVLPYTNWIPLIDIQHATNFSTPTKQQVIAKSPVIPGFEVKIPRNVSLRAKMHGHQMPINSITITPIPLDRSPFPLLPGTKFVVTLQTHGAVVEGPGGKQDVKITYPNVAHLPAGKSVDLVSYDAAGGGWKVDGKGYVTSDGLQIEAGPGVITPNLACAKGFLGNDGPGTGPKGCGCEDGDPVDLGTGLFVMSKTDLAVSDTTPLLLSRTYRQGDQAVHAFGVGTVSSLDINLEGDISAYSYADLVLPAGGNIHYTRISPGNNFSDVVMVNTASPTAFNKSVLSWNAALNAWEIVLKDGTRYQFGNIPVGGSAFVPLTAVFDRYDNGFTITRDNNSSITGPVSQVTTTNGRWIQFQYDTTNHLVIKQAQDNIGRTVSYDYDSGDRLIKVTDANGGFTQYGYDSQGEMLTLTDPKGITFLTNEYTGGLVTKQTMADNTKYLFAYTKDPTSHQIIQTDVTNPRNFVRRTTFNSDGYSTSETVALGTSLQQTTAIEREAGTGRIVSVTDPLNRKTSYTYDSNGIMVGATALAGRSDAVTTTYTYDPIFQQLTSVTDALNHTTSYAYDGQGNMTSVTDALGNQLTATYGGDGRVASFTDPMGKTTQFNYSGPDLVSVTDPLGRTRAWSSDGAGRAISTTNSLGQIHKAKYDAVNQKTQLIDPLQGTTSFSHDGNGNLTTVTDARTNSVGYTYDNMDRVITRTDPLQRTKSYQYDENGNLTHYTNRKQQVTSYLYDALDRVTQVTYADSSTAAYAYDSIGRVTNIVDSISGALSYTYDDFDRITSETTPQGTVSYTYDAIGRQLTMTASGQATVNYTYDAVNRVTQIAQGSATVSFTYDALGRRTSVTQPNGLVKQYSYDDASQLTGLVYKKGSTIKGTLSYEHDKGGHVTRIGGSLANTLLPTAKSNISYDAANQQTQFQNLTITYDAEGNVTNDGTNSYTWDARGQLVSITGGVSASFQYDALGRRASKTIGTNTTSFLHNGGAIIQEQKGSTTTNILRGGPGEAFSRSNSSGTTYPMSDGLGNTIGLADSNGDAQTQYSYDPFGQTASSGASSDNDSQYHGNENDDGTGLNFDGSQYSSPTLQRALNDGSGSGNQYPIAGNNPINGMEILTDISNFVAGGGDHLTAFGPLTALFLTLIGRKDLWEAGSYTRLVRQLLGTDDVVDQCSDAYQAGVVAGIVLETAIEIAAGAEAEEAEALEEAPCNCFVAGTQVKTPDGEKAIEAVSVGDKVISYDSQTRVESEQQVTQIFSHVSSEVYDISIGGTTITATPDHPFWVQGRGWVQAKDLTPGLLLRSGDGRDLTIDSSSHRTGSFTVYNLEVANFHTYLISDLGVLVHNTCDVHGNSLKSTRPTTGYELVDRDTGEVLKYGETSEVIPEKRYSQPAYDRMNAKMRVLADGTKAEMKALETKNIGDYFAATGRLPPLNRSFH